MRIPTRDLADLTLLSEDTDEDDEDDEDDSPLKHVPSMFRSLRNQWLGAMLYFHEIMVF